MQVSMQALEHIDKTDRQKASKQLWKVLEPKIQYLEKNDRDFVRLAFDVMVEKHADQRRKSGEFYIVHPVAACMILTDIELEKESLAACLLHDVPEDTYKDEAEGILMVEKEFGKEVAYLVYGITKLSVVKYKGADRYAENLRKLFVAMSKDLRVIFIKLADRLHNLYTLKAIAKERPDKSQRIALESLEIYAPIAERLGISRFRALIEDLSFPFAYPDEFKQFHNNPKLEINHREKIVEKLTKKTSALLQSEKITYKNIVGRAKTYYSIFKKTRNEQKNIDRLHDLVALRIITDSIGNCYHILAILHKHYNFLDHRIKDYIKQPKRNGYQSIHTTVADKDTGLTFEFQIRTQKMHNYAEYGVASHWSYKENGVTTEDGLNEQNMKWISELAKLGKEKMSSEDYLKHVKLDVYQHRIFVLTPKGDVMDLPNGSSALDFAFKIHGVIGKHASMAKVNGEVVKLNHKLQNGDEVEIITDKKQTPKRDWLNWVKSSGALKSIRNILKNSEKK